MTKLNIPAPLVDREGRVAHEDHADRAGQADHRDRVDHEDREDHLDRADHLDNAAYAGRWTLLCRSNRADHVDRTDYRHHGRDVDCMERVKIQKPGHPWHHLTKEISKIKNSNLNNLAR